MTHFEHTVRTTKPGKPKPVGSGRFGAKLVDFPPTHERAIVKNAQFATTRIRGVPKNDMHRREVAAYRLDRDVLKFNVVPVTMLARFGGVESSVSKYIDGLLPRQIVKDLFKEDEEKPARLAKFFAKVDVADAAKIVLLDLIIGNADRHGLNVLVMPPKNGLVAIDNGMSFGRGFRYYRSVLHRYAFLHHFPFDPEIRKRLAKVTRVNFLAPLSGLIAPEAAEWAWRRLQYVLKHADHLDFHTLSGGEYGKNDFPSYRREMEGQEQPRNEDVLPLPPTGMRKGFHAIRGFAALRKNLSTAHGA